MKCLKCGMEAPDDSQFCPNCGCKIDLSCEESAAPMRCAGCGAEITTDMDYCGVCGMKLTPSLKADEQINSKICKKCGAIISPDEQYCGQCGAKVNDDENRQRSASQKKQEHFKKSRRIGIQTAIAVTVTLIIAAAGIAAGYFIYLNHTNSMTLENSNAFNGNEGYSGSPAATPMNTAAASTESPATTPTVQASDTSGASSASTENPVSVQENADVNTGKDDGFLYNSNIELVTTHYLLTATKEQIRMVLNEMYARHGYIFTYDPYKSYFESQSWYVPKYSSADEAEKEFNEIEQKNKNIIVNYEKSKGWR